MIRALPLTQLLRTGTLRTLPLDHRKPAMCLSGWSARSQSTSLLCPTSETLSPWFLQELTCISQAGLSASSCPGTLLCTVPRGATRFVPETSTYKACEFLRFAKMSMPTPPRASCGSLPCPREPEAMLGASPLPLTPTSQATLAMPTSCRLKDAVMMMIGCLVLVRLIR